MIIGNFILILILKVKTQAKNKELSKTLLKIKLMSNFFDDTLSFYQKLMFLDFSCSNYEI